MKWNEIMNEGMGDPMVFGRTVPNWQNADEEGDAAIYVKGNDIAQVLFRDGQWEVWFDKTHHRFTKTPQDVEAILKNAGFTNFEGIEEFGFPEGDLNESDTYGITGLDEIPSWDGLDLSDTAPVAEYQKRTRHADMPARVWVYSRKGKFIVVQGDMDFSFKTASKLAQWLSTNGYMDHVGTTEVNL